MDSFTRPVEGDAETRREELYAQALRLPPGERGAFLEAGCGGDGRLHDEVMDLLEAHERAGSFLGAGERMAEVVEEELARLRPESAGDRLGPYRLLERIGEGGFGLVWVAEQEVPIRRRVALKILKPGLDTREVMARFEQERHALALTDHPNIAKVLDAGATERGRPYFVMELVRGVKITDYCDEAQLRTEERLRLFIAVCNAVQHAHQKGIIHRDLKPSNILVTLHDGVPVPKVIDFGVAKATQPGRFTDRTVYTRFEQMVGTPLYMSPEQAEMSGLDVDTRSDIYSLGVLLYELLTGRTPFDKEALLHRGLEEMRRVVREEEPPRPSTLLSTLAAEHRTSVARHRQTDGSRLVNEVRGDLDWIVMKALEKDRVRRYDTATSLAQDIERHLSCEPVLARPPSPMYRVQRFARRHRTGVTAAAAIAASLVIGAGLATWMYFQERSARQRAIAAEHEQARLRQIAETERQTAATEAAKSRQVAQFLEDMLVSVKPSVALGRDTTLLREVLTRTEERLATDFKEQPAVEAELLTVMVNCYEALGEYQKAGALVDEALAKTSATSGVESMAYAGLLEDKAAILIEQGRLEEAEPVQREVLALNRKVFGLNHPMTTTSLSNLAVLMEDFGRLDEAEALHRETLASLHTLHGDDHLSIAITLSNLGSVLQGQSKLEESESVLREALAMKRRHQGDDTPDVAITLNNLANTVQGLGRLEESASLFRETLALQRRFLGGAHPNVASALNGLGLALHKLGRDDEAESLLREAVAIEKSARTGPHHQTARSIGNLSRVLAAQRRFEEAEAGYREAITLYARLPGDEHPDVFSWRNRLSMLLEEQGRFQESETVLEENLEGVRRGARPGPPDPCTSSALYGLAAARIRQDKAAEAEPLLREAIDVDRQISPDEHVDRVGLIGNLGSVLERQRKHAEAEPYFREAHAMASRVLGPHDSITTQWAARLSASLAQQAKWSALETWHTETLHTLRAQPHPDPLLLDRTLEAVAESRLRQDKFADAEPVARELFDTRLGRLGPDHVETRAAASRLVRLHQGWGNPEKAENWRQKAIGSRNE